MKMKKRELPS